MSKKSVSINSGRLKKLLSDINQFGYNPDTGGYNRIGFSKADQDVRQWFMAQMVADGLAVQKDSVGNIFGQFGQSRLPAIMLGSHLDTVPEGGAFDGSLGVAIALECVRTIKEQQIKTRHPVIVVATSEEEGRFGGMLGSQAITGQVDGEWLKDARDADGINLVEAMRNAGFEPDKIKQAAWPADQIKAFLELHIEQGPLLETSGASIGIVEGVSGVQVLSVQLKGVANHSGTTPMNLRADAFAGLAQIAAAIPQLIEEVGSDNSRITIGKVSLEPNFPHTIPGFCEFSIVVRDMSADLMVALRTQIDKKIKLVSAQNGLSHHIEERSYLAPTLMDEHIQMAFQTEARNLGYAIKVMPSGAGHDAQTMQALCPSGLIFVPSHNGISHAPEEWTDWEHIERGAQLMLNTLLQLAEVE